MTNFGDLVPADVVDTDPPDPLALARLIVRLEWEFTRDPLRARTFEELHPFERALRLYVITAVILRLTHEWKNDP